MELVTGYKGEPHITPEKMAELNRCIIGSESYVLESGQRFKSELVSNNLLKIRDGSAVMQGRHVVIPVGQSDELTIENGTLGMKRIDLVVVRYKKDENTKIEKTEIVVIKGIPSETAPVVPEHIEGDIRSGDMTADWPLYEVELDGISVVKVRSLFKTLMNMSEVEDAITELNSKLTNKYISILESQSGTSYTHNIATNRDIREFDSLLFETPYGVIQAFKINSSWKTTQLTYFTSGTWYAITSEVKNISSSGKSFTLSTAKWQSASANTGVEVTNVYGVRF